MDEEYTESTAFVPGGGRKKATILLLTTALLADCGSTLSGTVQFYLLQQMKGGIAVDDSTIEANDIFYGCIGLLQALVYLGCAIAFCMWFHRVYKNLSSLQPTMLTYSPAGAVWSFFIPFVNLVRPYRVAKEIWRESDPALLDSDVDEKQAARDGEDPPLITTWWFLFLGSSGVSNVGGRLILKASAIDELLTATAVLLLADVLSIGAAIAAITMVRRIDDRQQSRHVILEFGESP